MSEISFPVLLKDDPIVDCTIEIRFEPDSESAADIMPGLLYSELKGDFPNREKTPIAEIPQKVRMVDPNLRYRSTVNFFGDWGSVCVADCAIQIKVRHPYPGWVDVKPKAESILSKIFESGLIKSYERISVLYHNILTTDPEGSELSAFELDLRIGRDVGKLGKGLLLRTEIPHEFGVTIVQIQTGAEARIKKLDGNEFSISGTLLSVDSIATGNIKNLDELSKKLELVHGIEREVFFRMIRPETINQLNPIWE